jgi:ferric-dicitrate binding protein FerR (iron transport regulator)
MDQSNLKELLRRYLNDTLSEEELQQLIAHLRSGEQDVIFRQVIGESLASDEFTTPVEKERKDGIYRLMMRNANEIEAPELQQVVEDSRHRIIKLTILKKIAVAAAVVLMVGVSLYFAGRRLSPPPVMVANSDLHRPENRHAGSNKAILTLADGSNIALDSTTAATLTSQGGTRVSNLPGGILAYNAENMAAAKVAYNTVATPKGGQYQVMLPDGSKVWLNAASSLHFPTVFTGTERVVTLTGEAYFEIAANELKPFRVIAHGTEIKVLGTHFNVNSYPDEGTVNTTLLQGSVMVESNGKSALLKPSQQAQAGEKIKVLDNVDTEMLMAWKSGRFSYNNTALETIMRQVSRWYDVEVVFEEKITDTYSMDIGRDVPLEKLFRYLERSGGVHFSIQGRKITVTRQDNMK